MVASEVFRSPQFAQLSEQQRAFVKAMCENGWDKISAAHTAWACKDDKSAAAMADRALRNPRISQIIALIDPAKSRMTKDEALQLAAKHARTADKAADAIKCLQLIGEWEGWAAEPPPPPNSEKSLYDQADEIERQAKK